MQELRALQAKAGAIFEEASTPSSFGNDVEAIQAARAGVALCDRSEWGLLKLSGDDRLRFLHNQTTNDINRLQPGEGSDTVFVTSTGRTLDLATAYVTAESILILVSPNRRQQLMEWMDRYIFPFDRVELADISDEHAIFTLIGPESRAYLKHLGVESRDCPDGSHGLERIRGASSVRARELFVHGISVRVAVGSGLALPGYTLIVSADQADTLWSKLTTGEIVLLGDRAWEQLRIQQGRPIPEQELTEAYNPLEAGLWQAISFEKGCYIGQETIARLNTYKGVKQRLWGVELHDPAQPGTEVIAAGSKVGILTSYTKTEQGSFGLAYVRAKVGGSGLEVQVGDTTGKLVSVPFLTHEYYQPR